MSKRAKLLLALDDTVLQATFFSEYLRCIDAVRLLMCSKRFREIGSRAWKHVNLSMKRATTDTFASVVKYFQNIRFLDLRWINSSPLELTRGLRSLRSVKHIHTILLNGCSILTDKGMADIAAIPTIRCLSLCSCTGITDEGVMLLSKNPNLETLSLSMCVGLTDRVCEGLVRCTNLVDLDVSCCNLQQCIPTLIGALPHLQRLDLTNCRVSDDTLLPLKKCTTLKTLKLGHCTNITDSGMNYLAGCATIQVLDLKGNSALTNVGVQRIVEALPNLRGLDLSYCTQLTNAACGHIARLAQLRNLSLKRISGIDVTGIEHLTILKHLKTLDLTYCEAVVLNEFNEKCFLLDSSKYLKSKFQNESLEIEL